MVGSVPGASCVACRRLDGSCSERRRRRGATGGRRRNSMAVIWWLLRSDPLADEPGAPKGRLPGAAANPVPRLQPLRACCSNEAVIDRPTGQMDRLEAVQALETGGPSMLLTQRMRFGGAIALHCLLHRPITVSSFDRQPASSLQARRVKPRVVATPSLRPVDPPAA